MQTSAKSVAQRLYFAALCLAAGCGDSSGTGGTATTTASTTSASSTSTSSVAGSSSAMSTSTASGALVLTSSAYAEGGMIPRKHECVANQDPPGENVSPPLAWTEGPAGTQSYAIVMRDLDFANGFLHWVMWDIPANVTSLTENIEHVFLPPLPQGAKQAAFNATNVGYFGPCSPNKVNTYEITVVAIGVPTLGGLTEQSTKAEAAAAIEAAGLASASLSGES